MTGAGRSVRTARLDLRPLSIEDLDELARVFASEPVWHCPFGRGLDREETRAFLVRHERGWAEKGFGLWGVRSLDGGPIEGSQLSWDHAAESAPLADG